MRYVLFSAFVLAGCHTGDVDPMEQQPKLQEYETTRHFEDESAMRPLVEGTVPRERDLSGPPPVTRELVELGHEKFDQICTPCHGFVGDGNGSVAGKMSLRRPPSLHDARRRGLSSEWIFRAISEGYGMMPRFTTQLDTHERWAVVSYVRALQRSQLVDYDSLPSDVREEINHPKPEIDTPEDDSGEGLDGPDGKRNPARHHGGHAKDSEGHEQ